MSFKVYTGVRFKGSSFLDLHRRVSEFREGTLKTHVQNEILKAIASDAVGIYDIYTCLGDTVVWKENHDLYSEALALEANRRRFYETVSDTRFSFDLTLFPLDRDYIVGAYFCSNPLRDLFFEVMDVEEWSYWDQADPDEDSPTWGQREKDWYSIYPDELTSPSSPKFQGWNITLMDDSFASSLNITRSLVAQFIPDVESRIRYLNGFWCRKYKLKGKDETSSSLKRMKERVEDVLVEIDESFLMLTPGNINGNKQE